VGTALDAVLPARLGTLVMLLMFVAIIPGASLAGVSGAFVVEKIFFTAANALLYLYLFVSCRVPSRSSAAGCLVDDDWLVAAGIAVALGVTALLTHRGIDVWWLLPLAVAVVLAGSLLRATQSART
jgi:hypothetical protein